MGALKSVVPVAIAEPYHDLIAMVDDPAVGVDKPHAVVRLLVLECLRQFVRLTGRSPYKLHVPKSVEAALQIDRGRNLDQHGKLRSEKRLFDCQVVWDAEEFKVE